LSGCAPDNCGGCLDEATCIQTRDNDEDRTTICGWTEDGACVACDTSERECCEATGNAWYKNQDDERCVGADNSFEVHGVSF
jgi:hypothetical protein